jgi:trimeric autotransporter adhesin
MQAITALDAADAQQAADATAAAAAAAAAGSESYDALDLFLIINAADATEERRQALIAQRGAVEADLRQVSALLKLVQPALPQLRTLAASTTAGTASISSGSASSSAAAGSGVSSKTQQLPAMAMSSVFAAPAAVPKRALEQSAVTDSSSTDADTDSGSAKKKVKFAAEPEQQHTSDAAKSSDMQIESAAAAGASDSSYSSGKSSDFVPASSDGSAAAKPAKKARVYTAAHKPAAAQAKVQGSDDSSKVDTWTVPKGQTGDGKTSLNAKLGY